jgi:hypothetical protein
VDVYEEPGKVAKRTAKAAASVPVADFKTMMKRYAHLCREAAGPGKYAKTPDPRQLDAAPAAIRDAFYASVEALWQQLDWDALTEAKATDAIAVS